MKGAEDDESSSMSVSNDKQAANYEQMKALFAKYKVGEFAEDSSATISISKSHDWLIEEINLILTLINSLVGEIIFFCWLVVAHLFWSS